MPSNEIAKLLEAAERRIEDAVERAGYRVQAGGQQRARVRTGFMRGELEWQPGPDRFEGHVIAGANYTVFHEFGTRHMSAQPMLGPAVEEARQPFVNDLANAYRGI